MELLTQTEKSYRILLEEILNNKLPKGKFLSQRNLSKLTGGSVISVREALKRLEHEGLMESIPRWGVRIPVETRRSLIEFYEVREALEVMAAYIISRNIDEEKKKRLIELANTCDSVTPVDEKNATRFSKLHSKLHLFIAECTGNSILKKELIRINLRRLLFQSAKVTWAKKVDNWSSWHTDLVNEIISDDPQRAQEAMHNHIQHGLKHDLEVLDIESDKFGDYPELIGKDLPDKYY